MKSISYSENLKRFTSTIIKRSLKSIDHRICDQDNKSDSKSNLEREVCDPKLCSKCYMNSNAIIFEHDAK